MQLPERKRWKSSSSLARYMIPRFSCQPSCFVKGFTALSLPLKNPCDLSFEKKRKYNELHLEFIDSLDPRRSNKNLDYRRKTLDTENRLILKAEEKGLDFDTFEELRKGWDLILDILRSKARIKKVKILC